MRKFYLRFLQLLIVFSILMPGHGSRMLFAQPSHADSIKIKKSNPKITDTRSNKPAVAVKLPFVPFKPAKDKLFGNYAGIPLSKFMVEPEKVLNNVKVYPNPVQSDLNLTYTINKDTHITIKVMDVLGNEITTLLTDRVSAGVQTNSFNISSRLNSGFYFVRLSTGTETVTKRISVL